MRNSTPFRCVLLASSVVSAIGFRCTTMCTGDRDPAIEQIRSGGVTTSQVLPGSANMMGGESMVIKMTGGPDCPFCTTKSMVVREFRGLKMA